MCNQQNQNLRDASAFFVAPKQHPRLISYVRFARERADFSPRLAINHHISLRKEAKRPVEGGPFITSSSTVVSRVEPAEVVDRISADNTASTAFGPDDFDARSAVSYVEKS